VPPGVFVFFVWISRSRIINFSKIVKDSAGLIKTIYSITIISEDTISSNSD
jgi:hypothetical protein